jgi:hypothetical protein
MDLSELRAGDLSKKCVQLLQECQSTENVGKRTAEAIQNRLADFVLWSDGVGALASERASLDSRFKNRPRDLVMIKGVLTGFGRFLEELRQQLAENGQPTDEALRNVDSGLENLALLAVAIRRTGTTSRLKKAEDKFNPDEHRDLKKYLNLVARLRPNQDQNCPPPSEDSPRVIWRLDSKQKCLIEGVLRRRNWMLQAYIQSKALKGLEVIPEEDKLGEDSPASRSQSQNTDWSAVQPPTRPPPALTKSAVKKWSLPVRASSGVSASTPDSKAKLVIGKPIRKTSGTEGSATNITRIAASASYPGVKVVRDQTMFTCPCCFQTLGIEYSQGTLWKYALTFNPRNSQLTYLLTNES